MIANPDIMSSKLKKSIPNPININPFASKYIPKIPRRIGMGNSNEIKNMIATKISNIPRIFIILFLDQEFL